MLKKVIIEIEGTEYNAEYDIARESVSLAGASVEFRNIYATGGYPIEKACEKARENLTEDRTDVARSTVTNKAGKTVSVSIYK